MPGTRAQAVRARRAMQELTKSRPAVRLVHRVEQEHTRLRRPRRRRRLARRVEQENTRLRRLQQLRRLVLHVLAILTRRARVQPLQLVLATQGTPDSMEVRARRAMQELTKTRPAVRLAHRVEPEHTRLRRLQQLR